MGKRGDWRVDQAGETYTVDRETFQRTYRRVSLGVYAKVSPVWAEKTDRAGAISTKEGVSHYKAGAVLVYNDINGEDGYVVDAATFERLYEAAE